MKISNENKYYISQIERQIGLLFISDAIFQTFLTEQGLSSSQVSYITIFITITQVITYFLSNFVADKVSNVPRYLSKCFIGSIISFVLLLVPCFITGLRSLVIFTISVISVVIYNLFMGFYAVMDYKTPYYLIPKENYYALATKTSIYQGIAGIVASFLFSLIVMRISFVTVIPFGFIISSFMCFGAYRIYISFQNLTPHEMVEISSSFSFKEYFHDKSLKWFIPPHFIRGILNGVLVLGTVIFSGHINDDFSAMTNIATIFNIATFVGAFLSLVLLKKMRSISVTVLGCVIAAFSIMFLLAVPKANMFYFISLLVCIGRMIMDLAIPVYVMETTPASSLGFYTSLRLLLTFSGTAIGNFVGGYIASTDINTARFILVIVGSTAILEAILFIIYNSMRKRSNI